MGCDIHSVIQIKKYEDHAPKPDAQFDWITVAIRPGGDDRNYDTFAVLANVRNGSGFAGVKTGEGWEFISEPRGLPDDFDINGDTHTFPFVSYSRFDWYKMTPETTTWMGDHSHSWVTLTEIKAMLKKYENAEYEVHGMIDKAQKERLDKGETPTEWCGGTTDPEYVKASWKVPAIDRLWALKEYARHMEEHKPYFLTDDDVRLVFGFDS